MSEERLGVLGRVVPVGLIVLSVSGFQLGAALARPLFAIVGAQGASALRLTLAALLLAAFIRPWRFAVPARVRWHLVGYGVALAGLNLFFFMAIRTVPLGVTVALEFVGPLSLVVATSHRALDFVWAALAALGILLIMPFTGLGGGLDPVGLGFALLSAACWVAYILFGQKAVAAVPSTVATAIGVAVAAVVVLPVGIAHAGADLLRWDVLPLGLAVAIVSGSLPYLFEMAAMRRVPTRVYGVLTSLEPAFGALFGYLLLAQDLTMTQSLAIAAVMAASLGSTLTHSPPPPAI